MRFRLFRGCRGVLSVEGGLIGGIAGGIMAGIFVRYLFALCISWKFPMTTVNIVAGGISGLAAGLIMFYFLSPLALLAGNYIKLALESTLTFSPVLAGLLAGLVIWPAILGGVYHAVILPLVLLEMEKTGVSFLGAVDMVGLVMVAAGINLANVIAPRERSEAAVAAGTAYQSGIRHLCGIGVSLHVCQQNRVRRCHSLRRDRRHDARHV